MLQGRYIISGLDLKDTAWGLCLKGTAQRLAISRVRLISTALLYRESLALLPAAKIASTEHVGCMAVLGRILFCGSGTVYSDDNQRQSQFIV